MPRARARRVVARALIAVAVAAVTACGLDAVGTATGPGVAGGPDGTVPVLPDVVAIDGGQGGDAAVDAPPFDAGEPFLVTDMLSHPWGVVLFNGIAYIAENDRGDIRQVPKTGGANTQLLFTGAAPNSIGASAMGVYWGEQTKVRLKPFSGSVIDLSLSGSGVVLVDGDKVLVGAGGSQHAVLKADLDLSNQNDLAQSQDDPVGLVSDGTYVYWTNNAANTIGRAKRDGSGSVETVVTNENNPDSIAIVGSKIYWTVPGAIRVATIDVWTASDFVSGEGRPRGIAKSNGYLYWVDNINSTLRRAEVATGTVVTMASNEPQENTGLMNAITFDATYVYWVSSINGTLKRLPK